MTWVTALKYTLMICYCLRHSIQMITTLFSYTSFTTISFSAILLSPHSLNEAFHVILSSSRSYWLACLAEPCPPILLRSLALAAPASFATGDIMYTRTCIHTYVHRYTHMHGHYHTTFQESLSRSDWRRIEFIKVSRSYLYALERREGVVEA